MFWMLFLVVGRCHCAIDTGEMELSNERVSLLFFCVSASLSYIHIHTLILYMFQAEESITQIDLCSIKYAPNFIVIPFKLT